MPTKKLRQEYGDKVKFVLAYVVDPHPLAPDLSPYSGAIWQLSYSKYRQPTTFAERLKNANAVSTDGVFDVVVSDTLQPRNASGNNAFWCSWGPAPNSAWLIAKNKTVLLAQTWFDGDELNATLAPLMRASQ